MDNKEKYSYWEEYANYDLDTAGVMFETGRYLYSAICVIGKSSERS